MSALLTSRLGGLDVYVPGIPIADTPSSKVRFRVWTKFARGVVEWAAVKNSVRGWVMPIPEPTRVAIWASFRFPPDSKSIRRGKLARLLHVIEPAVVGLVIEHQRQISMLAGMEIEGVPSGMMLTVRRVIAPEEAKSEGSLWEDKARFLAVVNRLASLSKSNFDPIEVHRLAVEGKKLFWRLEGAILQDLMLAGNIEAFKEVSAIATGLESEQTTMGILVCLLKAQQILSPLSDWVQDRRGGKGGNVE